MCGRVHYLIEVTYVSIWTVISSEIYITWILCCIHLLDNLIMTYLKPLFAFSALIF